MENQFKIFKKFHTMKHLTNKGLVIFNPAVEGWLTGAGGQNFLKTCLRGDKKIVHSS